MECSCTTELISQRCGLVLVSVLHRAVFVQDCCSAKISDIVQKPPSLIFPVCVRFIDTFLTGVGCADGNSGGGARNQRQQAAVLVRWYWTAIAT
ncbi:hypothetical protein IG631_11865 [Alternaria alternata]|nr:hypothetical protein IG631_11865 [Alternaria alternata]